MTNVDTKVSSMKFLTEEKFNSIISNSAFPSRFKQNLEFKETVSSMASKEWDETLLLPIWNRGTHSGVLLLQPNALLYAIPFSIRKMTATKDGMGGPVICSFCYTWQSGDGGAFLVYYPPHLSEGSTVGSYCCSDLKCSQHARLRTEASVKSQTHMMETLTELRRVKRLQDRLSDFIYDHQLMALEF